jgi:hypothetical protein
MKEVAGRRHVGAAEGCPPPGAVVHVVPRQPAVLCCAVLCCAVLCCAVLVQVS